MALNPLLLFLSSLSLAVVGQDARLDTQLATPVLRSGDPFSKPATAAWQTPADYSLFRDSALMVSMAQAPDPQAKSDPVSVQFHDAKPTEVFAWLESHGVNFVVASGEVPSGTTITLNIQNQSMRTTLDAIAAALGGHWDRENGIRVFHHGAASPEFSRPFAKDFYAVPNVGLTPIKPEDAKKIEDLAKRLGDEGRELQLQFGPDFAKKMEIQGLQFQKQFGPDFQRQMAGAGKSAQDALGSDFQARLKKQIEDAMKDAKIFGDGKLDPALQQKIEQDVQKALRDAQRAMQEALRAQADSNRSLKPFMFDSYSAPRSAPNSKSRQHGLDKSTFGIDGERAKRLLQSLTPDQRDTQSKRGFIWWSDLTPEQQSLLGPRPTGYFEVRFKSDGEEIAVRGN